MNIVISGIGKFGRELTEHLTKENHSVIVIDKNPEVIEDIVNQFDVKGLVGNGASLTLLKEACDTIPDLFIATTPDDETNILACLVAKKLKIKQTIARVRNPEYIKQVQLMRDELGISMTLNPDLDTAKEIFKVVRFPSALKVESFANGKVDLVEIKIEADSSLKDKTLIEIKEKYQVSILVGAIKRGDEVIIPNGNSMIQEGDYVYIAGDTRELSRAFRKFDIYQAKSKSVMIIGGGKITRYLAELLLDNGVSVKIIEKNKEVCESLSVSLPNALIINGEGSNQKLLLEEGAETINSIITLTGLDETNLVISTFAKTLGVKNIITKIKNTNYDLVLKNIGLDTVICPKDLFASNIIRYVRAMENSKEIEFKTLYRLVENKVEALEFVVSEKTDYTSIPLKDLKMNPGFLIAGIIRENKVIIPSGKDTIEPKDDVIIITTNQLVKDVSEVFK